MFTKLWMQQDLTQIEAETSLSEAKDIIDRNNFRHLPVTEGKKLIGIITRNDINKALPSPVDSSVSLQEQIIASQTKVSSFGAKEAEVAATIRADLEKHGTPIGPYDTLIAGIALNLNATLVTHNTKEFKRVNGLNLEDWY